MDAEVHALLVSLVSQAIMTLVLGGMLIVFYRQYRHGYLRDWAFAWWADTFFTLAGAASVAEFWREPPSNTVRLGFTILSQCAVYLHLGLLLLGAQQLLDRREIPRNRRLLVYGAGLALGLFAALFFAFDTAAAMNRLLLRAGLHSVLSGIVFTGVAIALSRAPVEAKRGVARRFLMATMLCFGIAQLLYSYGTLARVLGLPGPPVAASHGVIDTVLVALIGFSMIGTLLEEERNRAQVRAEEAVAAERALRTQEARFRSLIENATDIITILEVDGGISYESPSVTRVLGWAPGELVGKHALDYIHPEDAPAVAQEIARTFMTPGALGSAVYRFRHCDGSYRVLHGVGRVLQEADGSVSLLVNSRDITDRTVAEEARHRSEERLALHVKQTPLGVIEWDPDLRVRSWNPAAAAIFGWSAEEVIGRPADFMTPVEGRGQREAAWPPPLAIPGGTRTIRTNVRRDGRTIECEWYSTPLVDSSGQVVAVASFVQDISEKRRMEQHLVQAQRLESIGRLAGGVAHDFNNLLTAIFAHTHMLRAEVPDDAPMRGEIEGIQAAADRAAALTRQLLAFARRQVVQPRPVALNDLMLGLVQMLRRLVGEHIEFVTSVAPEEGPVLADAGQLEQVVVNLVVNARDAMPEGGRLTLETGTLVLTEPLQRSGETLAPGRYATLSVSDTGHGIPESVREHIYEPFFTTKPAGQGTGLGLATCYGIVRQHGGHLWFESEVGRGTRFTICLPVASAGAIERAPHPNATTTAGRETILLVEDEPAVRSLAERTLRSGGYRVVEAENGQAALQHIRDLGPQIECIVTDLVMPRMGGIALAEQVRALHPGLPILFTSGYASETGATEPVHGHRSAFLPKPFTPADLLAAVRELLDREAAGVP